MTQDFIFNVADLLGRDAPPRHEHIEASVDWGLEMSRIRQDPPLIADITLTALPGSILARGAVRFHFDNTCRRCLAPYEEEVTHTVAALFEETPDEDSYPIEDLQIDLEPFLRDEALLSLPMLPECPDGCLVSAEAAPAGDTDEAEWRLEDTAEAEEIRRRLMAVVEDDDAG